jgi:uncharacterized protein (TIGR03437 family)
MRCALFALVAIPAFAGQVSLFPQPDGIAAILTDSAGNIYIGGEVITPNPTTANPGQLKTSAFVAKFTAGGTQVYKTVLAGSADDSANGIALGADGSVYVTGSTSSPDFPVTSGVLQPVLGAIGQAFLAKLSPDGQVQSATYFGGSAVTAGNALAVDSAGEVYLTGTLGLDSLGQRTFVGGFPTTPGYTGAGNGFFLAKFDPNLSQVLFSTPAYGGALLTLDPQGNIYIAGAANAPPIGANVPLQASPGAFQNSAQAIQCTGSDFVMVPCGYQFVEKLDPTATNLGYATFVAGKFGAMPAGIAVDAAGNAIVAGTTNSADYPVTAQAFQAVHTANAAPLPTVISPDGGGYLAPPPSSGYVTKLNATGTGLIWSTFFSGSVEDTIYGMAVDSDGYIYIAGQANSSDLPGLTASVPAGCRPSVIQGLGFVARLSPDGASLSAVQLIYGDWGGATQLALKPDGSAVTADNGVVATVDLFAPQGRLACFTDPADNVQIRTIAPGQVLGIFGSRIAPAGAAVPPGGVAPSYQGVSVTFNGIVAPILYTAEDQINVQVPYEIAGQASVEMQVVGPGERSRGPRPTLRASSPFVERKTFSVAQQQPSVFLSPAALLSDVPISYCGSPTPEQETSAPRALALNSDGTLNTCSNGAQPGSTVTIFMNGLGPTQPPQTTGAVLTGPPIPIAPGAAGTGIVSTTTSPGAISGVAQVQVQLQAQQAPAAFLVVTPTVAGVPSREPVAIWVAAQ